MKKIVSLFCLVIICMSIAFGLSGCNKSIEYFVGTYNVEKFIVTEATVYWGKTTKSNTINHMENGRIVTIEVKEDGSIAVSDNKVYDPNGHYYYEIKGDKIKFYNTLVKDYWLEKIVKDDVITLEHNVRVESGGVSVTKTVHSISIVLKKVG